MRIKVVQSPSLGYMDGIDLSRFVPGSEYDMGSRLAAQFLAEGWGEAVPDERPAEASLPPGARRFAAGGTSPRSVVGDASTPSADRAASAVNDLARRLRRRAPGD